MDTKIPLEVRNFRKFKMQEIGFFTKNFDKKPYGHTKCTFSKYYEWAQNSQFLGFFLNLTGNFPNHCPRLVKKGFKNC